MTGSLASAAGGPAGELVTEEALLGFPAPWLRHHCPCPDCRDPVTGQRLIEISSIGNEGQVSLVSHTADVVEVEFTADGHRATFSRAWLAANAPGAPDPDPRTEDGKVLWRAADFAGGGKPGRLPGAAWADYTAVDAVRAACLEAVATLGFARLRGVPTVPGTVLAVARTFGFVRETNYGELFDVRVVADPANLANTCRAIAPHTDNPYRDPVPTLQLLHCLRDAGAPGGPRQGGDTGLVDGFAAAAALRTADPDAFMLLTSVPWPFGYSDKGTVLRARQPLISLSADGRIAGVRLNNRSMGALRLPPDRLAAAYAAYQRWAELLARPEFLLTLRLAPGDCLIFDNTRILHARTAFDAPAGPPAAPAPGERHLQGCYADLDGLLSTLAMLHRTGPVHLAGLPSPALSDVSEPWCSGERASTGSARERAGACPR